jgi:hypothetical protein
MLRALDVIVNLFLRRSLESFSDVDSFHYGFSVNYQSNHLLYHEWSKIGAICTGL